MPTLAIIGGGPAGASAAIYALRAGAQAVIYHKDAGTLSRVRRVDNYYGFPDGVSGEELVERGLRQAERLGALIVPDEVLSIDEDAGGLTVRAKRGDRLFGAVVLATGAPRKKPNLPGLDRLEGMGVSYCAVCDGFFFRGKDVAVYGGGAYALHEALTLSALCRTVTVLTDGEEAGADFPDTLRVESRKVLSLEGEDALSGVRLADGTLLAVEGLFVAQGTAGGADLARKLGAAVEGAKVIADEYMATGVPGLYAAGDLTGGVMQVAKAVWQGAQAGMAAAKYMRERANHTDEEKG